jgi:hypothetical protein
MQNLLILGSFFFRLRLALSNNLGIIGILAHYRHFLQLLHHLLTAALAGIDGVGGDALEVGFDEGVRRKPRKSKSGMADWRNCSSEALRILC